MIPLRTIRRAQAGNVAMLSAAVFGGLAVTVAASVELSRIRSLGGSLQDSTDAAALHAAKLIVEGKSVASAKTTAEALTRAGLGASAGHPLSVETTVISSSSPVRVRVDATSVLPLPFGGLLGNDSAPVTRSALAEAEMDPICVLLLEPSAAQAWTAGGSSRVVGTGCAAQVNSTSTTALQSNGGAGASMKAINLGAPSTAANGFNPKPMLNQQPVADPIAPRITWPATAPCGRTNTNVGSARSLTPTVYCGGITVGSNGVATLTPGVHIIQTGGLEIKSGGRLLAPSNATIVLTSDTATINIVSGGSADIRAPTSGPWRGIAIAQKPQSVERMSKMQGGGALLFDGIIYLPSQKLHLTGGGDMSVTGLRRIFVARKLETAGNGNVFVSGDPTLMVESPTMRLIE